MSPAKKPKTSEKTSAASFKAQKPKDPKNPGKCSCWDDVTQTITDSSKFIKIEARTYFTDKYKLEHPDAVSKCANQLCGRDFTSDRARAKKDPKKWWNVGSRTGEAIWCCETADTSTNRDCMVAFCEECYLKKLQKDGATERDHNTLHSKEHRPRRKSRAY